MTPLMSAARGGHYLTVKELLEKDAKPFNVDKDKKNALEMAIENDDEDTMKAILLSDDWMQSLKNAQIQRDGSVSTPLRSLIDKHPDMALIVFNKCVTLTEGKDDTILFNFEFLEDLYSVEDWKRLRGEEVAKDHGFRGVFAAMAAIENAQKAESVQVSPSLQGVFLKNSYFGVKHG